MVLFKDSRRKGKMASTASKVPRPPLPINPLILQSPLLKNSIIKLELELLQNYTLITNERKDESLIENDTDKEYIIDNKNGRPKTLVLEYPFLRFFNNKTQMFQLVNKSFLEQHRYDLKNKIYVPYAPNAKTKTTYVVKVSIVSGSFKTVVLVDTVGACSIEIGTTQFIDRRKYVLKYLDSVIKKAPKLRNYLQVPKDRRYDYIFSDKNRAYYAYTMISDLCSSEDFFEYMSELEQVILYTKKENNKQRFYENFYRDTTEADHVLNSLLNLSGSLRSLHSVGVALIDIKPENILLCGINRQDIKLSDLEGLITIDDVPLNMKIRLSISERYSYSIARNLTQLSHIISTSKNISQLEKLPFVPTFRNKTLMNRINFLFLSFIDFCAISLVTLEAVEKFFLIDIVPYDNDNPNKLLFKFDSRAQFETFFDTVTQQTLSEETGKKYKTLFLRCYHTLEIADSISRIFDTKNMQIIGPKIGSMIKNVSMQVQEWNKYLASTLKTKSKTALKNTTQKLLEEVNNLKIHKPLLF